MATKIVPSLRAAMERLKHAGAVNGLCLAWRRQVLINLLPFEEYRAERLVHALQEAREHFAKGDHVVETFWFGFDGVHVLGCFHGECALAVLHSRAVDGDFLAKAAAVFLADAQLLVDASLNPSGSDLNAPDTQRLDSPFRDDVERESALNLVARVAL
jgi:hypothetical protein